MAVLLQLPARPRTAKTPAPSVPGDVRFELLDPRLTRRTSATFVLSIVAHVILVATVLIVPLFVAEELVEPTRAVRAFFVAPALMTPPPPPPPPPAPGVRPALKTKPAAVPTPAETVFRAPVDVPAELPKEAAIDLGIDGGVEGGVEGGVAGGVIGGIVGGLSGAPAPEATVAPVRVGGNIKVPRLVRRVDPVYPRLARDARVQGIVIVEAQVDPRGVVHRVTVLRGAALLDTAAVEAVGQWRYQPLFLNGLPTPFIVVVTVNFNLTSGGVATGQ